jgi:hypothetical protein
MKTGDKILTALGTAVTLAGLVSTIYGGTSTSLGLIAGGVGMVAKGCEEYYNGDSSQAVQDIVAGGQQVKAGTKAKTA